MSNNQIEQIKQFLHNEICERRDYSASKMCEEVFKFIVHMSEGEMNETEMMNNNPEEQDEQYMIDYNAMEEEWEMDNYNEMQ